MGARPASSASSGSARSCASPASAFAAYSHIAFDSEAEFDQELRVGRGKGSATVIAVAVLLLGLVGLTTPLLSGPPATHPGGSRVLVLQHGRQAALLQAELLVLPSAAAPAPAPCPHHSGSSGGAHRGGVFDILGGGPGANGPSTSSGGGGGGGGAVVGVAMQPRLVAWLATRKGMGFGAVPKP
jgi:hypothetical protein